MSYQEKKGPAAMRGEDCDDFQSQETFTTARAKFDVNQSR
jgi:hypothetical protein